MTARTRFSALALALAAVLLGATACSGDSKPQTSPEDTLATAKKNLDDTSGVKIDPADYGAPDPADLMNPDGGLSSLLTAAQDVKEGDSVRNGKVVLRSFTGTVPGKDVKAVIPSAKASADFDATFTVDDKDRLSKAVLKGPFYPKADSVIYSITFDDYGS